jgi:hypothetical protein
LQEKYFFILFSENYQRVLGYIYPMDDHQLKIEIQSFFADGLTIIIGSGLSAAEGISGMPSLSRYLIDKMSISKSEDEKSLWRSISKSLEKGTDLETSLQLNTLTSDLEKEIIFHTGNLIEEDESRVICALIEQKKDLHLTKLLNRCMRLESSPIPIVTTNYDRLIEFSAYQAGLGVDSLFVGTDFGKLSHAESQYLHCRGVTSRGRQAVLQFHPRIKLLKPHGSLDWYQTHDEALRSSLKLNLPRLIITPGNGKFEAGYSDPFAKHREIANYHIQQSERYIIIGYGFNDSHLQTHLKKCLQKGRPALILSRTLSDSARLLLKECSGMICLSKCNEGTKVEKQNDNFIVNNTMWWDIETLINEVLN